jgi:molecular chaperone DnaK (HSP70)
VNAPNTIFGIDLGTTYSAIAYVDEHGMPRVLMNRENTAVTPSVVYLENAQNVIVGQPARESGRIDPQNYVELIKRSMGDTDYRRTIHGQEYRPEQLSAFVLKKLKEDAEFLLGSPVTDAVITVPAYFNESQRMATDQAGVIAGLTVRGIIPEPVAAAVAYAATDSDNQTLLVYDLGGGTFDVTVMRVDGNKVRVICVDGDHDLGGRNWDEKVVAYLSEEWKRQTGSYDDPLTDIETQQELFKQAEEAKRLLTNRQETPLKVGHAGQSTRVKLSRETFDGLTADLLERTIALTRQALAEAARQGVSTIDRILLVGGSSYMPQVQSRLKAEFANVEQKLFEPEQAVAKGAAIYAASKEIEAAYNAAVQTFFGDGKTYGDLTETQKAQVEAQVQKGGRRRLPGTFENRPPEITNVCSRNFGVEALDDQDRPTVDYLIRRNSPVPATQENEYVTRHANQSEVDIKVYETDGASPPEDPTHPSCRLIKQVSLNLPAGLPADHPILVKFSLSEDGGRLRIEARDPASGRTIDESVDTFGALMEQEIHDMRNQMAEVSLG